MIIDQMKYLLYDIHQEVVDLGSIETKYSITFWNSSEGFTAPANQTSAAPMAAGDGFMNIPDGIDEELPFN